MVRSKLRADRGIVVGMRAVAVAGIAALLCGSACDHDVSAGDDGGEVETDGSRTADGRGSPSADLGPPLEAGSCPRKPPKPAGDFHGCAEQSDWHCIDPCRHVARLVCYRGTTFVREIRCDQTGRCDCAVGSAKPQICVVQNDGRTGCMRAKSALSQGCCKP